MLIVCVKSCPVCLHSLIFSLYPASTAAVCSVMPSGLCQGGTIEKPIERQGPEHRKPSKLLYQTVHACIFIVNKVFRKINDL